MFTDFPTVSRRGCDLVAAKEVEGLKVVRDETRRGKVSLIAGSFGPGELKLLVGESCCGNSSAQTGRLSIELT